MQIFIYCKTTLHLSDVTALGILKTVPAASDTGLTTCTTTPLQRGLIGTGLCESTRTSQSRSDHVGGEAAGTVFNIPDDGCCDIRNM